VARDFRSLEAILLGPTQGGASVPAAKVAVQAAVIPRRDWQAAETTGDYTLVGCSVGPGFDFKDFALLRDDAKAAARLAKAFPDLSHLI
jgi:predicted cupin superfamily sugar epimerase